MFFFIEDKKGGVYDGWRPRTDWKHGRVTQWNTSSRLVSYPGPWKHYFCFIFLTKIIFKLKLKTYHLSSTSDLGSTIYGFDRFENIPGSTESKMAVYRKKED